MKTATKAFAIAICLVIGLSAAAQNVEERAARMSKRQAEMLTKRLTLSDDQAKKVETILLDFNKKAIADIKADSTRKAPNSALVEKRNAEIKEVLTAEQYEAFAKTELAKSTFGPMQHRRGGHPGGHPEHQPQ